MLHCTLDCEIFGRDKVYYSYSISITNFYTLIPNCWFEIASPTFLFIWFYVLWNMYVLIASSCPYHQFYPTLGHENTSDLLVLGMTSYH
jgi:hypothetical protein